MYYFAVNFNITPRGCFVGIVEDSWFPGLVLFFLFGCRLRRRQMASGGRPTHPIDYVLTCYVQYLGLMWLLVCVFVWCVCVFGDNSASDLGNLDISAFFFTMHLVLYTNSCCCWCVKVLKKIFSYAKVKGIENLSKLKSKVIYEYCIAKVDVTEKRLVKRVHFLFHSENIIESQTSCGIIRIWNTENITRLFYDFNDWK